MELKLQAYQCTSCPIEFVIVCLSESQWNQDDDNPYCPKCGSDTDVHVIDCLDFTMAQKVQQYEITITPKPLEA